MEKPVYIQPSINLTVKKQIAYNQAYYAELQAWKESQDNTK